MRAFLFLVIVLHLSFEGITLGSNTKQLEEIRLIRRAYIDVAGITPTTQEIDWFVVYNTNNSYVMAVDHLLQKYQTPLTREHLLSLEYKKQPSKLLSEKELIKILFYVVGMHGVSITNDLVIQAKRQLINQALNASDNIDDAIDYICEQLMSRPSSLQENNMLHHKFKDACDLSEEETAWIFIVGEILKLPDVNCK